MTDFSMDLEYQSAAKTKGLAALLKRLNSIIRYFFAIFISEQMLGNPFYGGALVAGGQLAALSLAGSRVRIGPVLPAHERKRLSKFLFFILLIMFGLTVIYPLMIKNINALFITLFIALNFTVSYVFDKNPLLQTIAALFSGVLTLWPEDYEIKLLIWVYCSVNFILVLLDWILTIKKSSASGDSRQADDCGPQEIGEMMKVHTYRLYWIMTANTKVAYELSLVFAVCYLPYLPFKGFWPLVADVAILSALYFLAAAVSKFILNRNRFRELGKNTVFIVFSVIWIVINYRLYQVHDKLSGPYFYVTYLLLCICITVLASVILSMESDMQIIGTLGVEHFTNGKFELLKAFVSHLSMFYSRLIILLANCLLVLFLELNPHKDTNKIFALGKYGITLIPAVFLLLSVIAAIRQPLTRLYEQKLKKYILLKKEGKTNKSLEERLQLVFVEKYRKKIGIRLLMILLKPFFYHKIIGKDNVNTRDFPCVFVCNHSQIYGPIAAILNIPFYIKPWILNEMVDNDKIIGHVQKGTFDRQKWLPGPLRKRAGKIVGPLIAWAMQSTEPIPVFRNEGKDVIKAISMSIDALESDDNILLFPENPFLTGGYVNEGIGGFFSGFVNIAREYYKKTGKAITFYSIFANKRKHTLTFTKGITFDPSAPFKAEKERITAYLHDTMVDLYNSSNIRPD